jgi:hypothetical protein
MMLLLDLLPWAFSTLLLAAVAALAAIAFRGGEFAGHHRLAPPAPAGGSEDESAKADDEAQGEGADA